MLKKMKLKRLLKNTSYNEVKESKKEARQIGDSDREQLIDYSTIFDARI